MKPYSPEIISFAFCNRLYLRWDTYRSRRHPHLTEFDRQVAGTFCGEFGIHALECRANDTSVMLFLSLRELDTAAAVAGRLKLRVSQWLRNGTGCPGQPFAKGYYACTAGRSSEEQVQGYLSKQGTHHGYSQRILPLVYVVDCSSREKDATWVHPKHARTELKYHLVFATERRRGVFGSESSPEIARRWRDMEETVRFMLLKASFVPDHVHVAVQIHPSVAPAAVATTLMNTAEEVMRAGFREHLIGAGVERLWQASAYVGGYGALSSNAMGAYVRVCSKKRETPRAEPGASGRGAGV